MNIIDPRDINEAMENPVVDARDDEPREAQHVSQREEEILDEILDNIEANDAADPTPLITNNDWDVTADGTNTITNATTGMSTGVTYRMDYNVSTTPIQGVVLDGVSITEVEEQPMAAPEEAVAEEAVIIPEDLPRPEGMPYGPMTIKDIGKGLDEQHQRRKAEQRRLRDERVRKERIQKERRQRDYHENYFMTPNDLMIIPISNPYDQRKGTGFHFIKTDTQRKGTIKELNVRTNSNSTIGGNARVLTNGLIYDKNMNPLTKNYSPYRGERSDNTFGRITVEGSRMGGYYDWENRSSWIVVDKAALMRSKGRDFRIKNRTGLSIADALKIKKSIIEKIDKVEAFITYLKNMIGQVYDEANFEIVYEINFAIDNRNNNFDITFQFPNLVINNSIEMSHTIENLLTRLLGDHRPEHGNDFRITNDLMGLRTKFSPRDMYYGYMHSHLPGDNYWWDYFCMGEKHFMSTINRNKVSELDFETVLVGMFDHISWESLEGGPYMKMESIGGGVNSTTRIPEVYRTFGTYTSDSTHVIFEYLSKLDFTPTLDAFTLKIQNGKEATYDFNERLFVTKFLELLDADELIDIHDEYGIIVYEYIPSEHVFVRDNTSMGRPSSWKRLYKNAREKIKKVPVTYMNGGYVRPQLTDEKEEIEPTKRTIQAIHPGAIIYVARIIHFHLLNELKNVKV